ncbi:MAG: hypothetical protein M3R24_05315 [Chloroflexota bacterium]|nr:hypothetical protein [Chloroflexota bacterium]
MSGRATSQRSLSERVAGAIFWNTVAFPVKAAIKFMAGLVVLWTLTRAEYGLFQAAIGSLVAVIWTYTGLGISASILKFVPEVMERQGRVGVGRFLRQLFMLRLALLLSVVALLNVFSDSVINLLHLGPLGLWLLRAGSAIVLIRAVTDTCYRVLTAYFRQKTTNTLDIISALVQPLLIVVLVPGANGGWGFGFGVQGAIAALLIGSTIDLLLALYSVRRALNQLPHLETQSWPLQRLWQRFAASAFMNYIMDLSINITSPDFVALVLLWYARPEALADLEASWNQVMILLTYLVMPLSGIYVPMFSEIFAKREDAKLKPAYATLTRALLLATVPAGIGFITLAPHVFELLHLADKYPYAVTSAQVLTLFMFAESIVVVPHVILMVYERYRIVLASRLLAVCSAPLIAWVVIGASPVAAALIIGCLRFGSRAVLTPYACRHFGLRFPWRFALRLLLPSLVFAVVLMLLEPWLPVRSALPVWRNVSDLCALMVIGLSIFLIGFKAMGGLDDADRKRLATMRIPFRSLVLRHL